MDELEVILLERGPGVLVGVRHGVLPDCDAIAVQIEGQWKHTSQFPKAQEIDRVLRQC